VEIPHLTKVGYLPREILSFMTNKYLLHTALYKAFRYQSSKIAVDLEPDQSASNMGLRVNRDAVHFIKAHGNEKIEQL